MFVRRLGEARLVRLGGDRLAVRHDRLRYLDRNARVVLLEILQADLQVELPGAGDDVLSRLLNGTLRGDGKGVSLYSAVSSPLDWPNHRDENG